VKQQKEIYFHVGLGKVASTFLQAQVFPHLKDIQYIPPKLYRTAKQRIKNSNASKFLISREFDKQMELELGLFCKDFTNVKVIVFFRRHGDWMGSQYKRYVKNGWYQGFQAFFDLETDQGLWRKQDLNYTLKVDNIKMITGNKPLIITYDQLQIEPHCVFQKIADFTKTSIDATKIRLEKVHPSFSDHQLLFLETINSRFIRYFPPQPMNRVQNWIKFRPWWALYHIFLYFAVFLPANKSSIIDKNLLNEIDVQFEDDWQQIVKIANYVI